MRTKFGIHCEKEKEKRTSSQYMEEFHSKGSREMPEKLGEEGGGINQEYGNFSSCTRIYKLDETATTTVQRKKKITQKGIKQVSSCTSAERSLLVTTCCIISASGNTIPPVMVFPRKKFNPRMTDGAPHGTLGLVFDSEWMARELFPSVVKHYHPEIPVTIFDIARCVNYAFGKSMTPVNIKSEFRKTGIYPFDKFIFTDDDFASSVTDRNVNQNNVESTLVTDPNEPSTSRCTEENNQSKGTFISPQEFKGYPKAEERINKRKKREKAKSIIATDTPEKIALEAKQKERERKKTVQWKNVKRKVVKEDSTDEETENATILLTEISDDDIDFVEEINPPRGRFCSDCIYGQ
ncbi:hypothetical protein MML48_9g00005239 [Holotrichia oblita]|uniref:Uncharacterized protein n=1 Tax=Holotrichia oblita TaxID=644536 RepID=A0ACB9SH36_HOLOL|nr:hypothetical protein MML48_9g00005239 [Holotrichia oblita]